MNFGEILEMKKIIDLTHKITIDTPVHSYDDPVKLEKIRNLADHKYNDWKLSCGMHVATHIDGPGHLTDSDILLSSLPVDRFVGKGYLIDARNKIDEKTKQIDLSVLEDLQNKKNLQEDSIVLILTGFDKKFGTKEYFEDHPIISVDFANELAKHKIKMVGIDFFSPDKYPYDSHKVFFDNNILIIENLKNLDALVGIEEFTVVALPLKIETDSALARVVAVI